MPVTQVYIYWLSRIIIHLLVNEHNFISGPSLIYITWHRYILVSSFIFIICMHLGPLPAFGSTFQFLHSLIYFCPHSLVYTHSSCYTLHSCTFCLFIHLVHCHYSITVWFPWMTFLLCQSSLPFSLFLFPGHIIFLFPLVWSLGIGSFCILPCSLSSLFSGVPLTHSHCLDYRYIMYLLYFHIPLHYPCRHLSPCGLICVSPSRRGRPRRVWPELCMHLSMDTFPDEAGFPRN